jgi:acylphosphatase
MFKVKIEKYHKKFYWIKKKLAGCGFTKYTRDNCLNTGIRGWVKNSKRGTIVGKMQGRKEEVDKM